MKVKLLKKIRKQYQIEDYPKGRIYEDKAIIYVEYPHFYINYTDSTIKYDISNKNLKLEECREIILNSIRREYYKFSRKFNPKPTNIYKL